MDNQVFEKFNYDYKVISKDGNDITPVSANDLPGVDDEFEIQNDLQTNTPELCYYGSVANIVLGISDGVNIFYVTGVFVPFIGQRPTHPI